jgi:methylated-DNA-protein-cysteine methyltransferase-like protein
MDSVSERVYQIVAGIPKGKVMSYGQIGVMVGIGPRQVGRILHLNPHPASPFVRGRSVLGVPCHRVVHADGSLATGFAFGGPNKQRGLLEKEGVRFGRDKVDKRDII